MGWPPLPLDACCCEPVLALAALTRASQEIGEPLERLLAELRLAGLRALRGLFHLAGNLVFFLFGELGGLLLHRLRELLERLRGVALLLQLLEELLQLAGGLFEIGRS